MNAITADQVSLVASPQGRRVGLLHLKLRTAQVLITVLPKIWRQNPTWRSVTVHLNRSGTTTIELYELDRVTIHGPATEIRALRRSIDELEQGPDSQLVSYCSTPSQPKTARLEAVSGLLSFLRLAEKLELVCDQVGPAATDHHALRKIAQHYDFLALTEPLSRWLKPQYNTVADQSSTPRGRIDSTSLVIAQKTGNSKVKYFSDDLTRATQLASILRTTAHAIAVTDYGIDLPLCISNRNRALTLSRSLSFAALLRPALALRAQRSYVPGPLESRFSQSLVLSGQILQDLSPDGTNGPLLGSNFKFAVDTDDAWERILNLGIRASSGLKVRHADVLGSSSELLEVPSPWLRDGTGAASVGRRPDFVVETSDMEAWIVDAKYKQNFGAMSAADGYQMYAYAQLARFDQSPISNVALAYPSGAANSSMNPHCDFRMSGEETRRLRMLNIPFPGPDSASSTDLWEADLRRIGSALELALTSY